jgi:hypothetical protein
LKSGIGLASAGGHNEENAVLPLRACKKITCTNSVKVVY